MYIVIELQKNTDGKVAHLVTEHNTLAEAESKFYSVLAYAAVSEISVHSAAVLTEEGISVLNKTYKR